MNEKTRILIVDDDPHLLQGMSRILKSAGYETIEAANGTDCLSFAIGQKPDLILLDVMLPDINGVEVCKRIKLDKTLADSYVVLLSSLRTSSDDQAEGLETGADGYIARPVSNRELLARVESLLRLKRAEQKLRQSEERFRHISSMTSDISYSCTKSNNAAYSIDWIMGAVERITGHSEDDIKALGCWRNLLFDEDLPIFDSKVLGLAPGTSASCELRLAHKTGKVVWVASFAECVLDMVSSDSLRLYGALVDITERKLAEEDLRTKSHQLNERVKELNCLYTISKLVVKSEVSLDQLLQGVVDIIPQSWQYPEITCATIILQDREFKTENYKAPLSKQTADIIVYGDRIGGLEVGYLDSAPESDEGPFLKEERNLINTITERLGQIIERKQEDEALRKSEVKLRLITESSKDVFWMSTPDIAEMIYVSPSYEKLWGRTCESLYNSPLSFMEAIHPEDRERVTAGLEEHAYGHWDNEYRIVQPDGTVRWIHDRAYQIRDEIGNLKLMTGTARDITERKQIEKTLCESEEHFMLLVQNAPVAIFVQTQHQFAYLNPTALKLFGAKTQDQLLGQPVMDRFDSSCHEIVKERIHLLNEGKKPVSVLEEIYHKLDGAPFDVEVSAEPIRWSGHDGAMVFVRDITERKQAEEAIRQSEEKFSKAFFLSPDAVLIARLLDGKFVSVNEGFKQIFGYAEIEVIGKTSLELHIWDNPEDRNRFTEALKAEGKVNNFEARFRTKDWDIRYGLMSASIIVLNGVDHILNVIRDITERVRAEEEKESLRSQLLQSQKMEAIGTLAGGVAHDFNNLLQITLGYSELLLNDKNPEHQDYNKLHKINSSARRGADLVQRLMVFSRKGDTKPRSLNLNQEVTQIKKLLVRTIPKMIAIELSLQGDLPVINADPVQVEQILLNLVINAKDAMPESGGKLTIETRKVTLDEDYRRTHLEAKPGHYVMLSVEDTGHGMSQETVQHIFEPFFTTKGVCKGTGLGLAMVYGIMKHHEGFINCYSELGHGTTFRLYFPVVSTEIEENSEQDSAVPLGGSETILLVDDEEFLCDIASQILTRAGYTVLTATNAKDALDLYRNQRSDISLVLLDLIMPEMGGKECFQELLNINPQVRVILSSGFLSDGTTEEARVFGFRGFIEKPYNMRQLLGLVREVLDGD